MIFKSAIDPWFYVVIIATALVLIGSAIAVLASGENTGIPIIILSSLLAVGLPIWLLFSTYYQIGNETLNVRSGPFKWTINLAEIESVTPSNSPLSSPALSLDRLKIKYGNGKHILVSPRDKAGFIEALQQNA